MVFFSVSNATQYCIIYIPLYILVGKEKEYSWCIYSKVLFFALLAPQDYRKGWAISSRLPSKCYYKMLVTTVLCPTIIPLSELLKIEVLPTPHVTWALFCFSRFCPDKILALQAGTTSTYFCVWFNIKWQWKSQFFSQYLLNLWMNYLHSLFWWITCDVKVHHMCKPCLKIHRL